MVYIVHGVKKVRRSLCRGVNVLRRLGRLRNIGPPLPFILVWMICTSAVRYEQEFRGQCFPSLPGLTRRAYTSPYSAALIAGPGDLHPARDCKTSDHRRAELDGHVQIRQFTSFNL